MRLVPVVSLAAIGAAALASYAMAPVSAQPDVRSDYSFAVIGDVPYGSAQIAAFPQWIQQINHDRAVRTVVHLGDIKNGSSVCSDAYFALIRSDFDTFEDPLVYTPGDNEWTDCHRANNGGYNPLERLAKVREVFFDQPGTSLGQRTLSLEVGDAAIPENVIYHQHDVTFAVANVPGSNNAMQPWTGNTEPTAEQAAVFEARNSANIAELHQAFAEAKAAGDRGVLVMQQADMFDPTYVPTPADISYFTEWIQALIDESSAFDGPVYLFNGDSHVYNSDHPLATGNAWLTTYGVTGSADNLTRVTVDGSGNNHDYLRVTINKDGSDDLLSWVQVPYAS